MLLGASSFSGCRRSEPCFGPALRARKSGRRVPLMATLTCSSTAADGGSSVRASSGFTHGGASRRCETWIVLELCSLGSLQVSARRLPLRNKAVAGSDKSRLV